MPARLWPPQEDPAAGTTSVPAGFAPVRLGPEQTSSRADDTRFALGGRGTVVNLSAYRREREARGRNGNNNNNNNNNVSLTQVGRPVNLRRRDSSSSSSSDEEHLADRRLRQSDEEAFGTHASRSRTTAAAVAAAVESEEARRARDWDDPSVEVDIRWWSDGEECPAPIGDMIPPPTETQSLRDRPVVVYARAMLTNPSAFYRRRRCSRHGSPSEL